MLLPGGATGICQQMNGPVGCSLSFQLRSQTQCVFPHQRSGLALAPGNVLPDERASLGVCVNQQNSVS